MLELDFFEVRFSQFLRWRDVGFPDRSVYNCFAMPALRSGDGAFLLGEMGPSHSCAGQLYFPAGTPDRADVVGDRVDLDGSVLRELFEETGIHVTSGMFTPGWHVVFDSQRIACMKVIDWPNRRKSCLNRWKGIFPRKRSRSWRVDIWSARGLNCADDRLPGFMIAFLDRMLQQ